MDDGRAVGVLVMAWPGKCGDFKPEKIVDDRYNREAPTISDVVTYCTEAYEHHWTGKPYGYICMLCGAKRPPISGNYEIRFS